MIDPTRRFSATADDYAAARPDYPEPLFDWILGLGPARTAADLGSGTGISTRQLAARGIQVVGIEPNDAMRAAAAPAPGVRYVRGVATATGLPDASVDLVISGQAFHWFDLAPTLAEIRRVCTGHAVAFWNVRRESDPLMAAYEHLLLTTSSDYATVRRGEDTRDAIRAAVAGSVEASFPHAHVLDRAGFHRRASSSSYVVHGVADRAAFGAAIDRLFDTFAAGDRVRFVYDTVAIAWPASFSGAVPGIPGE